MNEPIITYEAIITYEELKNIIYKYYTENSVVLEPGKLGEGLAQEIMNYLAKKIHPNKE